MNRKITDNQMQRRLVREEFSRASTYAAEYEADTPIAHLFSARLQLVSEMLSEFHKGRVLDIGCGPAKVAHQFRDQPIEYYGVDISEAMLEECRNEYGNDLAFQFALGDMEAPWFSNSQTILYQHFDIVLCLGALEYALDGRATMKEMARVTKVGGAVIVAMQNPYSPYRAWLKYGYTKLYNAARRLRNLGRTDDESDPIQPRLHPAFKAYTARRLRECFEEAGLHVVDEVYYDFNVFFSPLDKWLPRASVAVSRKLERFGRSLLRWIGSGYIIKGEKDAGLPVPTLTPTEIPATR